MTAKREIERPIMRTYSNLTKAITDGQRIDWEALDGRAGAVTSDQDEGTTSLEFTFSRDTDYDANTPAGLTESDMPYLFGEIIGKAWDGEDQMTLWVEGDLPLRPVTADTLPLGTCLRGQYGTLGVLVENRNGNRTVIFPSEGTRWPAGEVKVQQVFGIGTFKPDGQDEA